MTKTTKTPTTTKTKTKTKTKTTKTTSEKLEWRPRKTWSDEDASEFEDYLTGLGTSFIADERRNQARLAQATKLLAAGGGDAVKAALRVLAPAIDWNTRGTNYHEARVVQAHCLRAIGDDAGALAIVEEMLAKDAHRLLEEPAEPGAIAADCARRLSPARQVSVLDRLGDERHAGTEPSRADFEYFCALALLNDAAGRPKAAATNAYSALDCLTCLRKSERASAETSRIVQIRRLLELCPSPGAGEKWPIRV